jgi:HPt (histidine-containing phosphotransfer) domain-containing protein
MSDDPDVVELLDDYLDSLVARVASLDEAAQASDFAKLARIGHELAGSGGCYGFDAITTAGRALEHAARDRAPDAGAKAADLARLCKRAVAGRSMHTRAAS